MGKVCNNNENIASLQKKQISLANNNSEMHDKIINEARNVHKLQAKLLSCKSVYQVLFDANGIEELVQLDGVVLH